MVRTGLNWGSALLDFRGTTRSHSRGLRCKRLREDYVEENLVCASAHILFLQKNYTKIAYRRAELSSIVVTDLNIIP